MSLDGDYDPANVFARILRGELPSAKVYEDDKVLVLMDAFPQVRGHTLVIHKTSRARNLLDVEPQALNELILAVQKTVRAVREALDPDGIQITQFNGAPAGQTVFHLHFHVLPRWNNEAPRNHGAGQASSADMAELAKRIGAKFA